MKSVNKKIINNFGIQASADIDNMRGKQPNTAQSLESGIGATIAEARQLYEHIVELYAANKLLECKTELEKSLKLCPGYTDATKLLAQVDSKITEYSKDLEKAKNLIASKEYKQAVNLLRKIVLMCNTEEVKTLYHEAVGKENRARRYRRVIQFFCLSTASVTVIAAFIIYSHLSNNNFMSYCAKANIAFASRDYVKAVAFYNDALNVYGFRNDESIRKSLEHAQQELERKIKFDKLMYEGKKYLEYSDWIPAEKAFNTALAVPGYENNSEATISFKKAIDCNKIRRQQSETEFSKNYAEASEQFRQIRLLDKKDMDTYEKGLASTKTIADFVSSDNFRYITDGDKQRLAVLKNELNEYIKNMWHGPIRGQPWTAPDSGMKFVYVAPGSFKMGSHDGESEGNPEHSVTINKGYWLGKYEVTQNEYQSITGINPSKLKGGNKPVETVSWNDAVSFCKKLTEREFAAGRLPSGYEYRLPTEAEWEFAADGGGSTVLKYSGSNSIDSVAWYGSNSGKETHEVGTKAANSLGLFDMSGNVWEWCLDGGTSSYCVLRGGSWDSGPKYCQVAFKDLNSPGYSSSSVGFRVAIAHITK